MNDKNPLPEQVFGEVREVPFTFDELFFSRTDEKGIIISGNSVFQRISFYSWDELLRKPHNVIRHPDMPKGVFWLLWQTIKAGKPIGAYVKNRAKDGRHYWVFAIITPIEGGYLSVRLKPSSKLFSVVVKEYAALVAAEHNSKLKPAESGQMLIGRLAELGFQNYDTFMSSALSQEIAAREQYLSKRPDKSILHFDELIKAAQSLLLQAGIIFDAYKINQYVPFNLRIQAAQLEESGAIIGVISNNYSIISNEIKCGMDDFITSAREVFSTINNGQFLLCTAKIQGEVLEQFHTEDSDSSISQEEEMVFLGQQQKTYQNKAMEGLHAIEVQAGLFHQACTEMKRLAAGLEVTRIMGKVESARLNTSTGGLNELINDLEGFQQSITSALKEIEQMNRHIQYNTGELLLNAAM